MNDRGLRFQPRIKAECSGQSGQALIELAVSLPLFVLLLLGAAEFGRLAYIAIELTDAAKAAAQYGSQNPVFMTDTNGMLLVAQQSAPFAFANCTNFTATVPSTIPPCTCMASGSPNPATPNAATCATTCPSGSYLVHVLQISTSASCNPIFHAPGFSAANITLRGSAVQEVLN